MKANDSLTQTSTRRTDLDTVGGVMIVYMIFLHVALLAGVQPQFDWLWPVLYFFMPWFFFKAGMFHNSSKSLAATLRGSRTLIVNFVVFSLPAVALYVVMKWKLDGISVEQSIVLSLKQIYVAGAPLFNLPLWFLLSLFFTRIIACLSFRTPARATATSLALLAGAYALHLVGFDRAVYPANIFLGVFFYGCGYMLRERQYSRWWLVGAIAVFAVLNLWRYSVVDFRSNMVTCGDYLIYVATSMAGCVIVNNIFRRFPVAWLSYIGRNSMGYYVNHFILIKFLMAAMMALGFATKGYAPMAVYVAVCIVLLPPLDLLYRSTLGRSRPTPPARR